MSNNIVRRPQHHSKTLFFSNPKNKYLIMVHDMNFIDGSGIVLSEKEVKCTIKVAQRYL